MFARWRSTVLRLMTSSCGDLARWCGPRRSSLTTSRSRGVSGSSAWPRRVARALEVLADQRRAAAPGRGTARRACAARQASTRSRSAADLEHVARRAGLQRLEEVLLVVVHGEHQHPQRRAAAGELARGLKAGQARHRDVEHGEVDVVAQPLLDRLGAVARLGDHVEVGLGVEDHAQAAADDGVVVGEQDAGVERHGHADAAAARRAAPRCRAGATARSPAGRRPASRARASRGCRPSA